jgi:hypothetical protein
MGGSIKKAQVGHVIITVAKTLQQKEMNLATIAITKSRLGKDGVVFENCKFNNELLEIDTDSSVTFLGFEEQKEEKNMSSWHSYPSSYALGHRYIQKIFDGNVLVEEKIDGSQFSFGRFNGELKVRSKGKEMFFDAPEKLFKRAVEAVSKLDLKDGYTYRGEVLDKPKHNALTYNRVPQDNVILFDINKDEENYLSRQEKELEALRIGLEVVPVMYDGVIDSPEFVKSFLDRESILGGQKIEGVVIKNYNQFGIDSTIMIHQKRY